MTILCSTSHADCIVEKVKGSSVNHATRRGLLRNAAIALAGRADQEAIAALKCTLNDPEELVMVAAEMRREP